MLDLLRRYLRVLRHLLPARWRAARVDFDALAAEQRKALALCKDAIARAMVARHERRRELERVAEAIAAAEAEAAEAARAVQDLITRRHAAGMSAAQIQDDPEVRRAFHAYHEAKLRAQEPGPRRAELAQGIAELDALIHQESQQAQNLERRLRTSASLTTDH